MMRYKLIVFDWDGTLMDSEARIVACMEAAFEDAQVSSPGRSAIRDIIGLGLREAVASLLPQGEEALWKQIGERYRHHFLDENGIPSELFPDACHVLDKLRDQGHLLAVATGKSRRGLNAELVATGLHEKFHATRCADETFSKPHPAMLQQLMEELGVAEHATLMVGDTEYDLQMAHNAGTPALAVCFGVHDRERLLRQVPLGCIDRLLDIPPWLERQTAVPGKAQRSI
jgi:phosphoglycolate phosphatase